MDQYILDAYDDPGLTVLRHELETGQNRQQMTKIASGITRLSPEKLNSLSDAQFALRIMTKTGGVSRKFPISSPEEVWLSSTYFKKTAGLMPKMAQAVAACNLHHAAKVFNMELDEGFAKVASQYSFDTNMWVEGVDFAAATTGIHDEAEVEEMFKKADSRYWGITEGETKRYWLGDSDHVKVASAYFSSHSRSFTPRQRHEFASRIAARAYENGQEEVLNMPNITKHAGAGFGMRFEPGVEQRIDLSQRKGMNPKHYVELVKKASELGPAQTAAAMGVLDKAYGLSKYHDEFIDDNYATVYGSYSMKTAEESMEVGDQRITRTQLASIPEDKFKKAFGLSAWNAFKSNPIAIASSMPRPEQEVIAGMIP